MKHAAAFSHRGGADETEKTGQGNSKVKHRTGDWGPGLSGKRIRGFFPARAQVRVASTQSSVRLSHLLSPQYFYGLSILQFVGRIVSSASKRPSVFHPKPVFSTSYLTPGLPTFWKEKA